MEEGNTPRIGPAIQRQRKGRGLTLERLAAMSGVSKSMLSQIERGQANPTFAVLWSLTRALKIEFSDLLDGGSAPSEVSSVEVLTAAQTPEIKSADGTCRLRILSPPRLAGTMEWYELHVAPGGALDSAPHAPGAFEHFTALTPGFRVSSDGSEREVGAGETARYQADVPHRIVNASDETATGLLIVLYA